MSTLWATAEAADGRTYYYNTQTRETSWERPAELDVPATPATPAAPAAAGQSSGDVDASWREAKAADGKTYYYNSITRLSAWEPPAAFLRQQQNAPPQRPEFVAGGGFEGSGRRMDSRDHGLPQKPRFDSGRFDGGGGMPWEARQEAMGFRGATLKSDEPEYATAEQAEEAFFKLLKKHGISPSTPWIEAVRTVGKDREYRAIKEPGLRKQAFEKYVVEMREQEKGKEKERKEKMREEFKRMLTKHDEITHYTRWKTAKPLIEHEAVYVQAGDDEDLTKQIYNEYIMELKKQHVENQFTTRKSALSELEELVSTLVLDANMAWSAAQATITDSEQFASDDRFKALTKLDILNVFDKHMKRLDHAINEAKQNEKRSKIRSQRKARDNFVELLESLKENGKIQARTKWSEMQPLVEKDARYEALLGTSGSSALDLFWDVVEREERLLRAKRNLCMDVLDEKRYEMTVETQLKEFKSLMSDDKRTNKFSDVEYAQIYERLHEKIMKRIEDDKEKADRHRRKAIDALSSVIKHLDPPLRGDDKYEDVQPKLEKYPEYDDLDDEGRKAAFEKRLRRVREREEEDRRRREDRDRARDYRNGDRDRRHRTRTPEVDAYEADRRKAQADRERSYRGGASSFGLSPPPRERRDDRYDDRFDDRRRSDRHESIYERERRERELERERSYVSRADPRDKGRSLDYGDEDAVGSGSRPGSVRKRRDSDDGSMASKKRSRRGKSSEPMEVDKEEPALQSGSEEGEIEEV